MSETPASAGEGVLVAIQDAAPGLFRPYDSEQATRFEAALEALAPNTRRAYGSALAAWGRWAALGGLHVLTPSPFALRAYLQDRAAAGAGISSLWMTVAALRKVQALVGVELTANDQVVTDTISGLARQATAPRQGYALTAEALAVVTATACQPRVGRGGKLETPGQARRGGGWSTSRCAGCCRTQACAALKRLRLRGMTLCAGTTARAG
ncbi:MAG: site-specific integrase [Caldilineaceae bacterium]|nr:site-specific integrase [Caldilineaceae bacterium]